MCDKPRGPGPTAAQSPTRCLGASPATSLDELTTRERQIAVAVAVAEGKANAAIAAGLHLSVATVKSHVSAILSKLGLDNRVQIALIAQDAQRG
jgi:DNA-binding NarL/FixJ family response regulator